MQTMKHNSHSKGSRHGAKERQREQELSIKEQQLLDWESQLYQKKLRIENEYDQLKKKMAKMGQ